MSAQLKIPFISLLALLMTSCGTAESVSHSDSSNENLKSFEINLMDGGGMISVSERLHISSTGCNWVFTRYGKSTEVNWIASEEELIELQKICTKYNYTDIQSDEKGPVFDRGGIKLEISHEGKKWEINNRGNFFIQEKWQDDFRSLSTEIINYKKRNVYMNMLNMTSLISPALNDATKIYSIQVLTDGISAYYPEDEQISGTDSYKVYHGLNRLEINAYYKDSLNPSGKPVKYLSDIIWLTATENSKSLFLDFKDGKIWGEFRND